MDATATRVPWSDVIAEGRLPLFILICLAVWLNAADTLIAATIMPTVARAIGGYAYFGWATAGYLMGSVLASASSGVLTLRFGLRFATVMSALFYTAGCVLSAVAPEIFTFLTGRVLQGIGGGWLSGLASVAIGLLFPNRLLPRVYSAVTSIWGIAILIGPMLGGLFADRGTWPVVFWLFAGQGVIVAAAAHVMLPASENSQPARPVAWLQLGVVGIGIALISIADLASDFTRAAVLISLGIGAFILVLMLDDHTTVRLFPKGSGDMRTVHGAGYATLFLLRVATMGLLVEGPAVLQTLRGLSALESGYIVGVQSLFWTATALPVSGLTGEWPNRLIRLGALTVLVGLAACALVFNDAPLPLVVLVSGLSGAGLGLSYAFLSQAILGDLAADERAIGGAGIATVRLTGAAAGSAMAAAIANFAGFADGFSIPAAQSAGVWVFVFAMPVAALACRSAWQMGRHRTDRQHA
ncbi:MAG TPA: MFS transporter [Stellaceae bacterium]|nr:MFS transporter [Stellaceae bacterium]